MRIRNASTCFAVLGLSAALAVSACAATPSTGAAGAAGSTVVATPASAGATNAVVSTAPVQSAPVQSAPIQSVPVTSAPVSQATVGTGTSIPAAPGTVGSTALPAESTAAPVTSGPGQVVTPLPNCTPATLKTGSAGRLVFTSAGSAGAPWFDGAPAGGRGYEAAVAAAVAKELGYSSSAVSWATTDRATVLAGTTGGYDVAVGEFLTPDQGGAVDYTTGYFSVSNSVVARSGGPAAAVTTLAGLKSLRVGAITGSAGLSASRSQIKSAVTSYPSVSAALAALTNGSIDAVVLPTSSAVGVGTGFTVVGQLGNGDEQPTQFGMVLAKGSPLTSCISAAIDQLRVTGTLAALVKTWVPAAARPLN